jgi:hypothetical protein
MHPSRLYGLGLEPITNSGLSSGVEYQLINCTSIPTARNAACNAVSTGVRGSMPGGGGIVRSVLRESGISTPIPITWISKWLVTPAIFSGIFHPASLNKGNNCFRKLKHSSPPALVYPKLIFPSGAIFSALIKSILCWSVRLRGLMRSRSSNSSLSAVAALVCCSATASLRTSLSRASSFFRGLLAKRYTTAVVAAIIPNAAVRISAQDAISSRVSRDNADIVVILGLMLAVIALAIVVLSGRRKTLFSRKSIFNKYLFPSNLAPHSQFIP